MNLSLLHTPDGVHDYYGKELSTRKYIMNKFENNIKMFGYDEIQTPTLEFIDVFSDDKGSLYENRMFKYIDRDGETLVLRPDFTPSVVRCVSKYFNDIKYPQRFYYKGNSFSNKGLYEGKAVEVTEMGIELLKDDTYVADAEVLNIVIENLLSVGLEEFKICISTKEENGIDRLNKIVEILASKGLDKYVFIDLSLDSNFKYYTGMIFKVYTYGVGDCICKGGRYNLLLGKFGDNAPAVGCVFMIDDIYQSIKRQKIDVNPDRENKYYILYNESNIFDKMVLADNLRREGKIVALVDSKYVDDEFKEMCKEESFEIM